MVYLFVGIGGVIGSVLRYYVSVAMDSMITGFPIETLTVNLIGSFLLGLLPTLFTFFRFHPHIINGVCTGLIGSFTTFSTFSVELLLLIEKSHLFLAFIYFLGSSIGGLFFAWTGYRMSGVLTVENQGGETS